MAISLGDNIKLGLGLPNDARYYSTVTNKPWTGCTEVTTNLAGGVGGVRYTGLTVNINGAEYWFKDGIGDGNLVPKELGGGGMLNWTGSTSNAVGTYISSSGICAQPNLTFNGSCLGVTGCLKTSDKIIAGGLSNEHATAIYQGKIDTTVSYGQYLLFKNEDNSINFSIANGAASGAENFFPIFNGKVISTNPALYFLGNSVSGTSVGTGIITFDGRINNAGTGSSTITLVNFVSGYGNSKAKIMADGTFCANYATISGKTTTNTLQVEDGASTGYVLTSDASGNATWQASSSGSGSGENVTKLIEQTSHGFDVMDVVGWSGGTYSLAIADGAYDGEILGLVTKCYNADCFDLTQAGYVTGLTSLTANTTYFLSDTTSGLLTDTKPTLTSHLVKSVIVADTTTSGWVLPYPAYLLSVSSGTTGGSSLNEFTITGDSSTTGFTVNHGLDNQFVMVQVVENTTPYPTVYTDVLRPNANCICITFDTPPTSGLEYKILIIN